MGLEMLTPIFSAAVRSGTPILYATLGEILTEKSGVQNLGLEGLMLVGALAGFATTYTTGSPALGILAAFTAGVILAAVHAFVTITLGANQVVSGLALTMLGTGVSALLGRNFVGLTITGLSAVPIPGLSGIPFIGSVLFQHDIMVYASYALTFLMWWYIARTRMGLNLRAVGDAPHAADSVGLSVSGLRYLYTLLGGGITALGGAYMSIAYSHMWSEGMTAGRGWIAVALVIFALWRPARAMFGAYLFGGVEACQLRIQAAGTIIPASLLLMLPYILTILVMLSISLCKGKGISLGAPGALGIPYYREERE